MEAKKLIDYIELGGHDARSYSGRGMYGERCVGIGCSSPERVVVDIIEAVFSEGVEEDFHDVCSVMRSMQTDSLGRGSIMYFPSVKWEGEEEEEEDY